MLRLERVSRLGVSWALWAVWLLGCQEGPPRQPAVDPPDGEMAWTLAGWPAGEALSPVYQTTHDFVRVGLMWEATDETRLEGRSADAPRRWSSWIAIVPQFREGKARSGHFEAFEGQASAFQLRLTAGPRPLSLFAEALERVGEAVEPWSEETPLFRTLGRRLAPESLAHPRKSWGARDPACASDAQRPGFSTIHHTATGLPDTISPQARLRQIQAYHIDTRGWCDIGYHFLIDSNGEAWQGRDETVLGAHVADFNTSNVGISFIGTYNEIAPTPGQLDRGTRLLQYLEDSYGVPRDREHVKGHREYRGNQPGDCPGDRLFERIDALLGVASGQQTGVLRGVVFADGGLGVADMSVRLPGAVVALDSGPSSVAREPDAYWSLALPYGLHSVTASLPGFRSASRSCPVTSGESAYCSLGLVPEGSGAGSLPAAPSTDPALVADPTPAIAPAADQIPQARPANSGCASAGSSDAPLASGLMLLLFSLFRRFLRTPQDNKVSLKK